MCPGGRQNGFKPEAPPRPRLFKRVMVALTKQVADGPRKASIRRWSMYQDYMDDEEKQEQQEQNVSHSNPSTRPSGGTIFSSKRHKFIERFHEATRISNLSLRLRRCRFRIKKGDPPPECLRACSPVHMNGWERHEERLLDPTSTGARQNAACGPVDYEAELACMSARLQVLERRNAQLVETLSEERARARQEEPEEPRPGMNWGASFPGGGAGTGVRSLGTAALKGRGSAMKGFERHNHPLLG